jgi:hypothetical protein
MYLILMYILKRKNHMITNSFILFLVFLYFILVGIKARYLDIVVLTLFIF